MKSIKNLSRFILGSFSSLLFTAPVLAQGIFPNPPEGVPTSPLRDMITKISSIALTLIGVIAVLVLIIGGFQYITAAGNPEAVGKAKGTIMYAIIGIIVALLSYTIIYFILKQISG